MKKKEIFADRIGQIHFVGGMVRFNFETLQPEEEANFLLSAKQCAYYYASTGLPGSV